MSDNDYRETLEAVMERWHPGLRWWERLRDHIASLLTEGRLCTYTTGKVEPPRPWPDPPATEAVKLDLKQTKGKALVDRGMAVLGVDDLSAENWEEVLKRESEPTGEPEKEKL